MTDRQVMAKNDEKGVQNSVRDDVLFARDRLHSLIALDMSGYKKRRARSKRLLGIYCWARQN